MRTSVDLPDPDSPTMPRLPPSSSATSTPPSAVRTARGPNSEVRGSGVLAADAGRRQHDVRLARVEELDRCSRATGSADDLRRRAALDDPAVAHHDDVVDDPGHEGEVVADEHQRRAVLDDELARAAP